MAPFLSPTLAAVSAIIAVVSLWLALHSARRSDRDSAREEALALAETRKQLVDELRATVVETRAEARRDLIELRDRLKCSPPDVEGALRRIYRLLERESCPPRVPH